MISKVFFVTMALVLSGLAASADDGTCLAKYGQSTECPTAQGYTYPDFEIKAQTTSAQTYLVTKGAESTEVIWTLGTPDIGPGMFVIAGKPFVVEVGASEILPCGSKCKGLVVWPKTEFEKKLREKYRGAK